MLPNNTAAVADHETRSGQPTRASRRVAILSCVILFVIVAKPVAASTVAYDPTANTLAGFSAFTGTVGLVFTVDTKLRVDNLGITTNSVAGGLDSSQLFTKLWRLNDPDGDTSDATLLANRNFTAGLMESVSGIAPFGWRTYYEAPDSGPVWLNPGETYVIGSHGFGGSPSRSYINGPNNVVIDSDINHLFARFGNTAGVVPTTANGTAVQFQGPTFNFSLPAPEPSTFVLASFGLMGLAFRRRRRNRG